MQVTPVSAPRVPAGERSGIATNHDRLSRTKEQEQGVRAYMIFRKVMLPACMPAVLGAGWSAYRTDRGARTKWQVCGAAWAGARGAEGEKAQGVLFLCPPSTKAPTKAVFVTCVYRGRCSKKPQTCPQEKGSIFTTDGKWHLVATLPIPPLSGPAVMVNVK